MPMPPTRFLAAILALVIAGAVGLALMSRRDPGAHPAALTLNPEGLVTLTLGSADAPVEVWEGSDYQCPDCVRYELEEMPAIRERFIATGRVRWRYLLFALPNHAEAGPATEALACAQEQGQAAAEAMHTGLFETRSEWAGSPEHRAVFRRLAEQRGLVVASWDECMGEGRHRAAVERTWREAQRVNVWLTADEVFEVTLDAAMEIARIARSWWSCTGSGVVRPASRVRPGEKVPSVPTLAAFRPRFAQMWRTKWTVEDLPLVPVTAAIDAGCAPAKAAAIRATRRRGLASRMTMTEGSSGGRFLSCP